MVVLLPQVYIRKRHTLIQVLPPANAYTNLFAICSCIFSYFFVGHSYIYTIRPVCVHHGVRTGCLIAILTQNSYMLEQITKEFEGRKYLYECTPFGYVSLWSCTHTYLMACTHSNIYCLHNNQCNKQKIHHLQHGY